MPFWQSRAAAVPGINRTPFFCKLARKSHTHCSIWQQLCCVWNMFGAILSCISKDTPLSQQGLRVIYLRRGVGSGCESSSGAICKSRIPAKYKKIIIRMKTRSAYKVGKVRISRKKNIPALFLGPYKCKRCAFLYFSLVVHQAEPCMHDGMFIFIPRPVLLMNSRILAGRALAKRRHSSSSF